MVLRDPIMSLRPVRPVRHLLQVSTQNRSGLLFPVELRGAGVVRPWAAFDLSSEGVGLQRYFFSGTDASGLGHLDYMLMHPPVLGALLNTMSQLVQANSVDHRWIRFGGTCNDTALNEALMQRASLFARVIGAEDVLQNQTHFLSTLWLGFQHVVHHVPAFQWQPTLVLWLISDHQVRDAFLLFLEVARGCQSVFLSSLSVDYARLVWRNEVPKPVQEVVSTPEPRPLVAFGGTPSPPHASPVPDVALYRPGNDSDTPAMGGGVDAAVSTAWGVLGLLALLLYPVGAYGVAAYQNTASVWDPRTWAWGLGRCSPPMLRWVPSVLITVWALGYQLPRPHWCQKRPLLWCQQRPLLW